ncbi:MAG: HAD family hydrolase [Ruminococcaceae bacterium]|nr:HAD family hydrolase [Oscillospiraceae bacterium]
MATYKIFASDLDATLLNDNLKVGEVNLAAIDKMREKGIEFIPVTGRCLAEVPNELLKGEKLRFIINSNGASICNLKTKTTHITPLKKDSVKVILDTIKNYSVVLVSHSNNEDLVDTKECSEEVFREHRMSEAYNNIILPVSKRVENLRERLLNDIPTEMLCLFFKYEEERQECFQKLKRVEGITPTSSIGGNMEILNSAVSKGTTLKNLAATLGVKPSEIIAVGDNHNDMSLTDTAGLSLAVSNGVDELKQKADKVICSNNENIADYIYKNFIG